jgi:aspartyl-tRNA(Asn)/glutamyl-tRNA(Gln) amidotransferase subunit A
LSEIALPARVVWSPTLGYAPLDTEVRAVCETALAALASQGCEVLEVDVVFATDPVASWITMVNTYLARTAVRIGSDVVLASVNPRLRQMMEHGMTISAVEFVGALDDCHRLNRRLAEIFHRAPVLLTPTTAAAAPISGELGLIDGKPEVGWVRFTYPFNLTRSPAGTVWAGFTSAGLPVGLQIIGTHGADLEVLRTMDAFERVLGLAPPVPPMAR